jgi:hypothetical protein
MVESYKLVHTLEGSRMRMFGVKVGDETVRHSLSMLGRR